MTGTDGHNQQLRSFVPEIPAGLLRVGRDGLHLLLHPDRPEWLVVNEVGWEIARLCNGEMKVEGIARVLAARYDIDQATALSDVEGYLLHLSRARFLKSFITDASPPERTTPESPLKLRRLHLNINENCNLRCAHCGVVDGTEKKGGFTKEKVLEIIDELSGTEGSSIAVSGGEPLLHKDIFPILEYASKKLSTSLSTNATLIDEDRARRLASIDIRLQISLDGPDSETHDRVRGPGSFDRTLQGVKLLKEYGAVGRVAFFTTVLGHNIEKIPALITLASGLGVPSVRLLPVQRLGAAKRSWEDLSPTPEQYLKLYTYLYREMPPSTVDVSPGFQGFLLDIPDCSRWCRLGETLAVDASGDIYPCSLMMHPDFLIGNIHKMTLEEAVGSEKLEGIINACSSREDTTEGCIDCTWKNFCQASCPGSVFFKSGSLWATDDLCEVRKKLYPEVIFEVAGKRMDSTLLRQSTDCEA